MSQARAEYPTGPVVEEFATKEEPQAVQQEHTANRAPEAVASPAHPGWVAPRHCSFCGKHHTQVGRLIAKSGSDVAICDECIALCNEILGTSPGPLSQSP